MQKLENVELSVPVKLSKEEQIQLYDNSIERVINSAMQCASFTARYAKSGAYQDFSCCYADLEDLKVLLTKLWDSTRSALFVKDQCR